MKLNTYELAAIMAEQGIENKELAANTGIPLSTLYATLRNGRASLKNVKKIAVALSTDVKKITLQ